ncbi:hypothetical protein BN1013_01017 [Candidatus Rubidus massiliensis]|nr:hypothetical protein BN1013_01017 [Candidatus Rubidus massiliensis]
MPEILSNDDYKKTISLKRTSTIQPAKKIEPQQPPKEEIEYTYSDSSCEQMARNRINEMNFLADILKKSISQTYETKSLEKKEVIQEETVDELQVQISDLFYKIDQEIKSEKVILENVMVMVCQILVLLSRLSNKIDRNGVKKMTNFLLDNANKQAESYNTKASLAIKITSSILYIASAFAGFAPLTGSGELFFLPTKTLATISQPLNSLATGTKEIGDIVESSHQQDRIILNYYQKEWERIQSEMNKGIQQAEQSKSEAIRAIQQTIQAWYELTRTVLSMNAQ